jgi:DNA adenine methylase
MPISKVSRPIVRYHGGKWKIAPWIIENMPPHRVYVEPFGGGGSVLLRKPRLAAEVYNDLDGRVVQVFRVLRDPEKAARVRHRLSLTPFARAEFDSCYEPPVDEVDEVCKTIMLSLMGYGSDSITRKYRTGFRSKLSDERATPAASWLNYYESIDAFVERLRGVVIEQCDAAEVMLRTDTPQTLFFVDPPYLISTRTAMMNGRESTHGYKHEMTDDDHRALAVTLRELQGMVMLCGYPSALYEELFGDWQRIERKSMADGAKARTECLWFNPAAWYRRPQMELMQREICQMPRRSGV